MLEVTPAEFAEAAVVVIIDADGKHRWSSTRTLDETANALESIADSIRDDARASA